MPIENGGILVQRGVFDNVQVQYLLGFGGLDKQLGVCVCVCVCVCVITKSLYS